MVVDREHLPDRRRRPALRRRSPAGSANPWDVSIGHNDVPLIDGADYTLTFTASASVAATVRANVQLNEAPFTAPLSREVALTTGGADLHVRRSPPASTRPTARCTFQLGGTPAAFTFCLDDVSLSSEDSGPPAGGPEQVENGDFADGTAGWYSYGTTSAGIVDGQFCPAVPGGLVNPWDAGIGQNDITAAWPGREYTFSFDASADPRRDRAGRRAARRGAVHLVPVPGPAADRDGQPLRVHLHRADDTDAGAGRVPGRRQRRGVHPVPGQRVAARRRGRAAVRAGHRAAGAGQPGRLPARAARRTPRSSPTAPTALPWQLRNAAGTVVAVGPDHPARRRRGLRPERAHHRLLRGTRPPAPDTRWSPTARPATRSTSPATVYQQLRSDSLQFFYIQRSGIAIDGALVGDAVRPPGRSRRRGAEPGRHRRAVPGRRLRLPAGRARRLVRRGRPRQVRGQRRHRHRTSCSARSSAPRPRPPPASARRSATARCGCPSAATRVPGHPRRGALGAGVPAAHAGARPASRWPGMAHHKMHDAQLDRPAAAARGRPAAARAAPAVDGGDAQPGRHRRAVRAAVRPVRHGVRRPVPGRGPDGLRGGQGQPGRAAPIRNDGNGGGSYSDGDVSDEFYWAAAELYLTTGEAAYLADVTASPHHTGDVFTSTGFGWGSTAALGRLDLATVPERTPGGRAAAHPRRRCVDRRRRLPGHAARPRRTGCRCRATRAHYFWGANSNILNNAIVLATAFDLTGDASVPRRRRAGRWTTSSAATRSTSPT